MTARGTEVIAAFMLVVLIGGSMPVLAILVRRARHVPALLWATITLSIGALICFAFMFTVLVFDLQHPKTQFDIGIRIPTTLLSAGLADIGIVLLLKHMLSTH